MLSPASRATPTADGLLHQSDDLDIHQTGTARPASTTNVGTVTGRRHAGRATPVDRRPTRPTTSATQGGIDIEKFVAGQDADSPTGPYLNVGATATFTYVVKNTGNVALAGVSVSDDKLGAITGFTGDTDNDGLLDTSETWTYTKTDVVKAGQYTNIGTATGTPSQPNGTPIPGAPPVNDTDPANYFGSQPAISLVKYTNGEDANEAPGPNIAVGGAVAWTYVVSNTGNVALTNVTVVDDQGVPVSCPMPTLAPHTGMTCTASGVATAGQYANIGTVTGTPPVGSPVTQSDPSHYYGAQGGIDIEKYVAGQDADSPTGPYLNVGAIATFTYVVKNTSNVALAGVSVSDDKLGAITGFTGDTDNDGLLDTSETWTYTKTDVVKAGQYTNIGTATGTPSQPNGTPIPGAPPVNDTDPANYFGSQPAISLVKYTNGVDANEAPGPNIAVGGAVAWTYVVSNTGNVALTNVTVVDDQGVPVSCPAPTLAPRTGMTCTASGVATAGQYANIGTVTGTPPVGAPVTQSDPSHYYGAQQAVFDWGDLPDGNATTSPSYNTNHRWCGRAEPPDRTWPFHGCKSGRRGGWPAVCDCDGR